MQLRPLDLDTLPVHIRFEAIRRGGYALALHDYDNDGLIDMYVGQGGSGLLLRNTGSGYVDVTDEVGLGDDEFVKAAVFADFNNDGVDDLLLVRFEYNPTKHIIMYKGNADGTFHHEHTFVFTDFKNFEYDLPMPIGVGHFNDDTLLDFYVGFPGKLDFTTLAFEEEIYGEHRKYQTTGAPQGLFFNTGNFQFVDMTDYLLYDLENDAVAEIMDTRSLFPHSAVATDLNHDGFQDIIVVDDRKNPSPIFYNNADGTFSQVAQDIGVLRENWGMSAAVGDYNNDGFQDIYMSGIAFRQSYGFGISHEFNNKIYLNDGYGNFKDQTNTSFQDYHGDSTGGVEFVDFDNDGDLDIYVVNGLWSGPNQKELSFDFLYASRAIQLDDELHDTEEILAMKQETGGAFLYDDGQATMSILKYYLDEDEAPAYSMGGYQRNKLYRNNGDGTFTEIAYLLGVDSIADGYIVALADLNHDGSMDFVLRNADPGTPFYTFPNGFKSS